MHKNIALLALYILFDKPGFMSCATLQIRNGTFNLDLDPLNGHFQNHFRFKNENFFKKNFTNSIRNLNFDFEYSYFMLSNHTNFCRV
jgi:hypothetical protein